MFAAGDVFAECDLAGRLTYLTGAVGAFTGAETAALVGRPLEELVAPSDRPLLQRLVARARARGRAGPLRVLGRAGVWCARVRACAAADDAHVHLAFLDLRRWDQPGPADSTALIERLRGLLAAGEGVTLSLVGLEGIEGLAAARARSLMAAVEAVLRAYALDDGTASRLEGGRYAVAHAPECTQELLADLRHVVAAEGGGAVTLEARTLPLLDPVEDLRTTAEALALALHEFASGTLPADVGDLGRLLNHRMATVVDRVGRVRRAVRGRDFTLVFQPVVTLAERRVHHYEALIRPPRIPPGEFVGLAEEVGLVAELDLAVLERVLEELAAVDAGRHGLRVAVNLSARSLLQEGVVARIGARVKAHGIAPSALLFEVTETFASCDLERLAQAVAALRAGGHEICVDDFGVGAASFSYLQALPVDYVKIDGSFTDPAPDSREERLLRAMLETCRGLGLRCVVERVERETQAERLAALGAELAQGFLFGRGEPALPLPEGAVRRPRVPARRRGARETWA